MQARSLPSVSRDGAHRALPDQIRIQRAAGKSRGISIFFTAPNIWLLTALLLWYVQLEYSSHAYHVHQPVQVNTPVA